MDYDWVKIRRAVRRARGDAVLLGEELPVTLAEALRQQKIKTMTGVGVTTRDNVRHPDGSRTCTIYLTEGTG